MGLHRRRIIEIYPNFQRLLARYNSCLAGAGRFSIKYCYHKSVFRTLPNIEVRGLCESCLVLLQIFDQGSEYAFNNIKYQKLLKTNEKKKTQPQKKSLRLAP